MNILYLNMHEGNELGGSSLSLYNLLCALPAECHPIVVVQQQGVVYDFFASRGIEVWEVPAQVNYCGDGYGLKYYTTWPIRYCRDAHVRKRFVSQIVQRLGDQKIDIVHSNSATIDVGNMLARRLGARHVWHLREFVGPDAPFKPFLPFSHIKRELRKADATICITAAIARHYDVESWDKNRTMFDAVGKREDLCDYGQREKMFIFCGGENRVKRPDWAIRAFVRFHALHPDYRLHIVGYQDQQYHQELLKLIPESAREAVIFEGYSHDVRSFLRRAQGLLMCTEFEAMGRVTVEAQLNACPVIGAASGGTLELVEDDKTGLLFDTIEQCTDCMNRLVEEQGLPQRLAHEAQQFAAANFLEEAYGQRLFALYTQLTSH